MKCSLTRSSVATDLIEPEDQILARKCYNIKEWSSHHNQPSSELHYKHKNYPGQSGPSGFIFMIFVRRVERSTASVYGPW